MKVIIFCGGYGTRLWPVSRKSYPKPFIPLIKGKSFFQITYKRYRKVFDPEEIFVSTEDKHLAYVRKQAPAIPKRNIILEPERKDTLAATGLAVTVVNKYFPSEPILISWAKHLMSRESVFLNAMNAAADYSQETGLTVSIDSKPEFPSVHNGWVKKGRIITNVDGFPIYEQIKQVEKPKRDRAIKLFASGKWLIHTGYKVWNAEKMFEYMEKFQPSMFSGFMKIKNAWGTSRQASTLAREYNGFVKTSVDLGLLTKMPKDSIATIEADMGWEDVGISWETFYKALFTPKQKTVIEGGVDTELLNSEDNLIIGPKGKMIMLIGVSGIAVVDTADGLLVCRLDQTQKVKELYKKLERYKEEYVE